MALQALPLIGAMIGSAALGAGASMYEGRQNRKAQERAAKEQRTQDAFDNLMRLMTGGTVQSTPVTPVQGSTGADALRGLASIAQAYAQGQALNQQSDLIASQIARNNAAAGNPSSSEFINMYDIPNSPRVTPNIYTPGSLGGR